MVFARLRLDTESYQPFGITCERVLIFAMLITTFMVAKIGFSVASIAVTQKQPRAKKRLLSNGKDF